MIQQTFLYKDFILTLSKRFEKNLDEIQYIHGFEAGPEFEIAICKTFRTALPQRFGICRGHAMDRNGNSAGDDVIIYDRFLYPTLRLLPQDDYSTKEWVPIEAVCAYIEAKHTINLVGDDGGSLEKALQQVSAVKALCSQRQPVPLIQITPQVTVGGDGSIKPTGPPNFPATRNPMFAMVIARHVSEKKRADHMTDPQEIRSIIQTTANLGKHAPDVFAMGGSLIGFPSISRPPSVEFASPFLIPKLSNVSLMIAPGAAFGISICLLLNALDWLLLGQMPWKEIIADCLNTNKQD